mmetsp:Transcript_44237/g.172254  ORF Transcript_44237/g.172254 Transcript_44237/m.172254 type:complete len:220 (-) Transcript_44237:1284-1943(-)
MVSSRVAICSPYGAHMAPSAPSKYKRRRHTTTELLPYHRIGFMAAPRWSAKVRRGKQTKVLGRTPKLPFWLSSELVSSRLRLRAAYFPIRSSVSTVWLKRFLQKEANTFSSLSTASHDVDGSRLPGDIPFTPTSVSCLIPNPISFSIDLLDAIDIHQLTCFWIASSSSGPIRMRASTIKISDRFEPAPYFQTHAKRVSPVTYSPIFARNRITTSCALAT